MATVHDGVSEPPFAPSGEAGGAAWHVLGERIVCRISGGQTDGAYAVVEETTPPGGGVPLHVHGREDEVFIVLEGRYEVACGGEVHVLDPGAVAHLPKGIAHGFRNAGDREGRLLVTIVPAGFERFFARVDELSRNGPPDMDKVLALAAEFGLTFETDGNAP